ncbi:type I-E CRISPR-associated protein Cse1/CasA [Gordonia sp. TBRC 11910]|uniref:Type I-E CRISPR-associated protein Cse1/CasA n=1 Tax=Gordonia asplenii TaxID=2725283 RepID=A0A848L1N9_9ACTN|nr:type I-E CRISPR-associated protein Cse1/CasA [Gordonia asplenii]NMO04930.1 type I-E CRISPR-associated protein Cse1/CasA [Gordonia asplenii]
MKFNLVDDPWIVARTVSNTPTTVSLRELFHRAGQLTRVAGELPTQDFAVLRIALAVLYRTLWLRDETYDDIDIGELWSAEALPLTEIDAYLDSWRHRFELFDADQPFMLVPDLVTASGNTSGLEALVAGSPGVGSLFTMQQHVDSLTPAEAARWLIHCQAFDISGIKPGAVGDARVKGGKGYPLGIGWAGWLGGLTVEGSTLRETLIHNFVPPEHEDPDDLPLWELAPLTAAERQGVEPHGPIGLFTWPIRRIRLYHNGTHVTDALISNGDPVPYWRQQAVEPMSAWRYSDPQTKKYKSTIFMPRQHDAGRSLWRSLSALLPADAANTGMTKDGTPLALPARSLRALAKRAGEQEIPDHVVRLRSAGIEYGPQNSTYSELITGGLTFHPTLAMPGSLARVCVDDALDRADKVARALGSLGGDIAIASGGDVEPARSIARERAYTIMGALFSEWLPTVTDDNADARLTVWTEVIRRKVSEAARQIVDNAPPAALAVREVKGHTVSAGTADLWFKKNMDYVLGEPAPEPPMP